MTEPDTTNLPGAAREAGAAYETFRKQWRGWATKGSDTYCGFPMPFRCPPRGQRGSYAWRVSAIREWKLARERALGAGHARPPLDMTPERAANLNAQRSPGAKAQRAELLTFLRRA